MCRYVCVCACAELRLIRSFKGQPEPEDLLKPILGFMPTTTASLGEKRPGAWSLEDGDAQPRST